MGLELTVILPFFSNQIRTLATARLRLPTAVTQAIFAFFPTSFSSFSAAGGDVWFGSSITFSSTAVSFAFAFTIISPQFFPAFALRGGENFPDKYKDVFEFFYPT